MSSSECIEKCGIGAGIASDLTDITPLVKEMGMELIHRGQEGGGLASKQTGRDPVVYRDSRRFDVIVSEPNFLEKHDLSGNLALLHTRYRTTGPVHKCYAQPMDVSDGTRRLIAGTNGNIANFHELHQQMLAQGVRFDTDGIYDWDGKLAPPSDSEVLFRRFLKAEGGSWAEKIANGSQGVEGSYSVVAATDQDELIALRDPWGIRPLSFGRINDHFLVASETVALDKINARGITEIKKGEMWVFRHSGEPERIVYAPGYKSSYCDFEDWYFSHPTSYRNGIEVADIRKACAEQLAQEEIDNNRVPKGVDYIIYIPDTSRSGANPYGHKLGITVEEKIFKERYGERDIRSFLGSSDLLRKGIIDAKFTYSPSLRGKKVYVIDDTGVRLTTTRIINRKLRELGVDQIHNRFLAPKFVRPCMLGTCINEREELGAVEKRGGLWFIKSDEQIAQEIYGDSVAFLSMQGRRQVRERFGERIEDFCGYCHGDQGPFDFSEYDPDVYLERYQHVA